MGGGWRGCDWNGRLKKCRREEIAADITAVCSGSVFLALDLARGGFAEWRKRARLLRAGDHLFREEIRAAFDFPRFDEQHVGHVGLQRFRTHPRDGGLHSLHWIAINNVFRGNGIRIGNQMPGGIGILIGCQFLCGDNFDGRQFIFSVEEK